MRFFAIILVFLIWTLRARGDRRRFHRHVRIDISLGTRMVMSAGTPPQQFNVQLDPRIGNFVVMDVACETNPRPLVDCPLYCDNGGFRPLYCSPLCEEVSTASLKIRCGYEPPFDPAASSTFVGLQENVTEAIRDMRPLVGRKGTDLVGIHSLRFKKANKQRSVGELRLVMQHNLEFVRGYSFDRRILREQASGVFGISPQKPNGELSLIPQLKAMGILDRARISIQRNVKLPLRNQRQFSSGFSTAVETVTVGDFDRFSCLDWKFLTSYSDRDWTFEMTNVKLAGMEIGGINIGRISLEQLFVEIPEDVGSKLVADGLLFQTAKQYRVARENRSRIDLEFTVGAERIYLYPDTLAFNISQFTRILGNIEVRYTNEVRWSFGTMLLNFFCFGYDYDLGAVAWAERKEIEIV